MLKNSSAIEKKFNVDERNFTRKKIFVSHSHKDKILVDTLVKLLEDIIGREQISFIQSSNKTSQNTIDPGDEWPAKIYSDITGCDAVLAVITPFSIEADWFRMEIGFAKGKEKVIIPTIFVLSISDIPSTLKDMQVVNGVEKEGVFNLVDKIISGLKLDYKIRPLDSYIDNYLKTIKKNISRYPKTFTQEDLIKISIGPLGSVVREWMKKTKKR